MDPGDSVETVKTADAIIDKDDVSGMVDEGFDIDGATQNLLVKLSDNQPLVSYKVQKTIGRPKGAGSKKMFVENNTIYRDCVNWIANEYDK